MYFYLHFVNNGGGGGLSVDVDKGDTTVSLPCLVMLQGVSHQISEKFDTNEEVEWNLL